MYQMMKEHNHIDEDDSKVIIYEITFFFGIELILKIFSSGLFFEKNAFLKNPINITDAIIVIHDFVYILLPNSYINQKIFLFPMRYFTFLARLKILELKKILMSVYLSLKLIGQVFFIVFLFCYIYSLFGLYLFSGLFKKTCFDPLSGFIDSQNLVCGNVSCPEGFVCGKLIFSQYSVANFDNLLFSFMLILRILTLDDWNTLQNLCQKTFTNYIWIYFFSFIFLGTFFLINILLAVQKISYSQMNEKISVLKSKLKEEDLNLKEFYQLNKHENTEPEKNEKDKYRKSRSYKPSNFQTRSIKLTKSKTSKISSKDFATRISNQKNKQELLFNKNSQKIKEVQSSDYSKQPSTKIIGSKIDESPPTSSKSNNNKLWVAIKKGHNFFKKIILWFAKIVIFVMIFFGFWDENHQMKNLTISVLYNKKYFSGSRDDVLPFR